MQLSTLLSSNTFKKYFKNTSWMFFEQFVKIVSFIFVSIYVARYLGPEEFGFLSYAIAVTMTFSGICRFGMDAVLVRELVNSVTKRKKLLATALVLMVISSLLGMIFAGAAGYVLGGSEKEKIYIWVIACGMIFQSLLVFDYYFQSQVRAKISSISKSIAYSISALIKIYLVSFEFEAIWLAFSYGFDFFIIGLTLWLAYRVNYGRIHLSYHFELVKSLIKSAWPMTLSTLAIALYMRVDQVMIMKIIGANELGIYAAATRIYEGWTMVSTIVSISLLPAIVKLKSVSHSEYTKYLTILFSFLFWVNIFITIVILLFGKWLINFVFGAEFSGAETPLMILIFSSCFASLGSVTARYLTAENMERKIALRTVIALTVNILLNFFFIPKFGVSGAAISTLACLIVANYLVDFFDPDLKVLSRIKNNAIFLRFSKRIPMGGI